MRDTQGRSCSKSTAQCGSGGGSGGDKTFGLKGSTNMAAHKTAKFYTTAGFTPSDALVVRRGQTFEVEVAAGASVPASLTAKLGGVTLSTSKQSARVWTVALSATASVGRFALTLNGEEHGTVAVLFNPYVAADTQTYVPDAAERAEYLENENGAVLVRRRAQRGAGNGGRVVGLGVWAVRRAELRDDAGGQDAGVGGPVAADAGVARHDVPAEQRGHCQRGAVRALGWKVLGRDFAHCVDRVA